MVYLELIYVFFKIGLFGFGGGYAMISIIQFEVVDHFGWLTAKEFADMLAISQMTPGPISINTATYVGYEVAGYFGAFISTLSLCMPSIILMMLVNRFLLKNKENQYVKLTLSLLRPVLGGLILSAALLLCTPESFSDFGWGERNFSVLIFIASFVALYFFKVNPMILLLLSGVLGVLLF